ncbi:hypothetical protein [Arsenicicoccus dermatophilus]|uniref:hypothetical protein n=1 Tax=Arsenicicoccus dermatophilus TaxID=1076331 RepID=UPI001F4CED26|nr:hypothetical protein [Arsenicicoccus dermatophilus]MCH8612551.1 hypothetical protein [Arsenicicoccus dermatophilus]
MRTTAHTCPGVPGRANEDAAWHRDEVVVVVDGAGLPPHLLAGCSHPVAWYSTHLAAALGTAMQDRRAPLREALARAITQVRDRHADSCDLAAGSPSATVAAWRTTADRTEIEGLVLCDASLVVLTPAGPRQLTDDRLAEVMARAVTERAVGGVPAPEGLTDRELHHWALEATRNVPGGFWCAHHDPLAAHEARTVRHKRSQVLGVVAASDGATRAFDLLGTHTLESWTRACLDDAVPDLVAQVRAAEDAAADDLRRRGIKVHDDLTVVCTRL